MATDPRMSELIARWKFLRSAGVEPKVEDLCQEHPDLIEPFRKLISAQTEVSHNAETTPPAHEPRDTAEPALAPPQGPDELGRLGDFRLLRVVGRGGMGMVYEGEDVNLHRKVAVKVLLPGLADEKFRERFQREARAVASLNHDHVVTVHQVGQEGDTPFMVMEYLEGETLEDRLAREPIIPLAEAARVARETAQGLASAHAKEMIHRDVKPANIWLSKDGGNVKLLDFGLVRPQSGLNQLTAHGAIAGTIGYMSPEQIYAGPMDGRTDLYALGCVLYRMLTGSLPHEGGNTMAVLEAVVNHEPIHLDSVARKLPEPVADLLRRLLARKPEDRPSSAAEVADELLRIEKAIAGRFQPTTLAAAPTRPKYPLWGIALGGAIILLACVVGIATQYHRFVHRPNGAQQATQGPSPAAAAAPVLDESNPIKIGVLHSLTGGTRDSERPMYEAIVLAVEEINRSGGVLGRKVEIAVRDSKSDDERGVAMAEELIGKEGVPVIFGGWSSSGRKAVAEACAKRGNLLVYSCLGEGLEEHPNVVYVGGAPNQQLIAAAQWSLVELGKRRVYLVGSEYDLYSHAAHEILKDEFKRIGVEVVADKYLRSTAEAFREMAADVKEKNADVVFSTIDGPDNVAYFRAMRRARISSEKVPTVWLGVGEEELGVLDLDQAVGDVAVAPYFQSIPTKENGEFIERFKARFPARQRISDATAASYAAVYLWKQAVGKTQSTDPAKVREAFRGQSFQAPEGVIRIDEKNLYAWRQPRIARMNSEQFFEVIRGTEKPLAPKPFPECRPRAEWEKFLADLYKEWGNSWSGPQEAAAPEGGK